MCKHFFDVRALGATLLDVISAFRERVDPADLVGPDPWEDVRDRVPGRDVAFG